MHKACCAGIVVVFALACVVGCAGESFDVKYQRIHHVVGAALPSSVQMETLFPQCDHFITHYGRTDLPNIWNSVAYVGGRYVLTMQVKVSVDYSSGAAKVLADPEFFLIEVKGVNVSPEGTVSIGYSKGFTFSAGEWNNVYTHKGDFSCIGIDLNPEPIGGFDNLISGERGPRIPVILRGGESSQSTSK